jgi:hypothetical protein
VRDELIRAIKEGAWVVDGLWVEGYADQMADTILEVLGRDES